jgi:hypothetical protein
MNDEGRSDLILAQVWRAYKRAELWGRVCAKSGCRRLKRLVTITPSRLASAELSLRRMSGRIIIRHYPCSNSSRPTGLSSDYAYLWCTNRLPCASRVRHRAEFVEREGFALPARTHLAEENQQVMP